MTPLAPPAIEIVGCGDIGRRVARLYLQQGVRPHAWTRTEASALSCRGLGLHDQRLDLDTQFDIAAIQKGARILYTIPPPPRGRHDTRIGRFLEALTVHSPDKLVLISTTGVYGDCAGQWVNEESPTRPIAERACRRADAETRARHWATETGCELIILRVPGIYALDRLPLKRIRSGAAMVRKDQSPWSNRIHADDLARACYLALNARLNNEIINIADDAPCTMNEYFSAVADFAGLRRPPEISLEDAQQSLSPGMLSYLAESRRIDNRKMKKQLGLKLRYPSLRQGLKK